MGNTMKRVVQGRFFRKSLNKERVSLLLLHTLDHMVGFYCFFFSALLCIHSY